MLYYRVKPEYDQIYSHKNPKWFLIAWELYTPREREKYGINPKLLELVNISKRNVYNCFGARFEYGYGYHGKMKEGE